MSTDILQRRNSIEARIARASRLAGIVSEACNQAKIDNRPLAEVDPQGMLLHSAKALVPVAGRIDNFNVTLMLGDRRDWGLRVRCVAGELQVTPVRLQPSAARPVAEAVEDDNVVHELAHLLGQFSI